MTDNQERAWALLLGGASDRPAAERYAERVAKALDAAEARGRAEVAAKVEAAIESAWDEQCYGNRNVACESCRAYDDAIRCVRYAAALRTGGPA